VAGFGVSINLFPILNNEDITTKERTDTMPYQNISAVLAAADQAAITTKTNEIRALFQTLVNLTADERRALPKMSAGNEPFVLKALEYAEANPHLVPPFINVVEWRKDYTYRNALRQVLQIIRPLVESVDDTEMAAGSEAYTPALKFYESVKMAAELNVAGAGAIADDLGERFNGQGGGAEPPPANPPTP
jgi:mannose/cellobiose epimerase-like protein (N-acyl-D-glucosamine 2-epimerase family)